MEYLLMIYEEESLREGRSEEDMAADMGKWMDYTRGLIEAGYMRGGNALQSVSTATTVIRRNGDTITTDGPFAETKEQLGGYYLLDCPNLDEAIKWAAKCPAAETGKIELRPIMDVPSPE